MTLSEFVFQAIREIRVGIDDANKHFAEKNGGVRALMPESIDIEVSMHDGIEVSTALVPDGAHRIMITVPVRMGGL
jgi:hypothetical protein